MKGRRGCAGRAVPDAELPQQERRPLALASVGLERAKFIAEVRKHDAWWEIEALVRERWTPEAGAQVGPILVSGGSKSAAPRLAGDRLGQAGRDHQAAAMTLELLDRAALGGGEA